MAEMKEKYVAQKCEQGTIYIAEEVAAAIAADAVKEIEGVCSLAGANVTDQIIGKKAARAIRMDIEDEQITLDVRVMLRYGFDIPETAAKVQKAVSTAVASMTGFPIKGVNVHVEGIVFE